jgi:hypothetical protein
MITTPDTNKRVHADEPHLVEHEPIRRERLVIAALLLVVMGGMWVRIFWKRSVSTAKAKEGTPGEVTMPSVTTPTEPLKYKPLPIVPGRHDRLAVDIFSPDNWQGLAQRPDKPLSPSAPDARRRMVQDLFGALGLEGIMVNGEHPEAMVEYNGRYHLVSTGSTFDVRHQGVVFTLRVVAITENQVIVAWEDLQTEIRIPVPKSGDEL